MQKIKGTKIKMPSLTGPKLPEWDLSLKGPKMKGDLDISVPKIEGDIKTPKVDIEGPEVDIEGHKGGFKLPKFKMPHFGGKSPKLEGPDVDVSLSGTNIDLKGPGLDIKGPEVDLESPSGKIKGTKFKMPTITGPKISMPDVDFNLKGPSFKGDMSLPKLEGDIKAPGVDINAPDFNIQGPQMDVKGPKGGFDMPHIKMPSFGFKGPKLEGPDVDVNLPKANIDVNVPKVDIEGPEIDIEGPDAKIKGTKIKMPSLTGPKLPEWDLSLKGPKMKGGGDVSLPNIEGDIKTPKVDITGPEVDIEGPKGGFNMPKFKMPGFGVKGPKLEGPEVDGSLPTADIGIKAPEVDITGLDVDIESPGGKFKGPRFNMPNISGPKLSMPGLDFNLKGSTPKGGVDVSLPKIEGDIKAPGVDVKAPEIDIEGHRGGFGMPHIKMPSFGFKGPKVEGPDVDVNLPKANIDVNIPEVDIKGDIKAPKIDIEGPEVDIEGPKGGFKMPKFKLPGFGLKGPKLEGHDVNVSLPGADIDIKAPGLNVKGPEVELESPSGKIKGPRFQMPNISGPKVSMPDVDFNLKGPTFKGDMSLPKIEGDIKAPGVDINAPDFNIQGPHVDVKGPKGGFDMPHIKMPSFGLKGPKLEGPDVDVNLPKANIDFNVPEVDMKGPEFEGPDAKFKGTKIKLPSLSGPKLPEWDIGLKGPNMKGNVDVSGPTIEGDIKAPKVEIEGTDFDFEGQKGGFKMPKFTMPTIGGKVPKLEGPEIDVSLPTADIDMKGPEVEGFQGGIKIPRIKGSKIITEMDVSVPKMERDIKDPKANIKSPAMTIEGGKTGVTFPKFKGPKFGMKSLEVEGPESMVKKPMFSVGAKGSRTDVHLPDTEASLDAPDIDISVKGKRGKFKLPKVKAKAKKPDFDIATPAVDVDVDTPNIHVKGTKVKKPIFGKLHFPDVEFDIKSPKLKGDGSLSEGLKSPDIDLPSVSLNAASDGYSMEFPDVSLEGSGLKSKTSDANFSVGSAIGGLQYPEGTEISPKIKVPKFGIALPQLKGQEGGGNVKSEFSVTGGINLQPPSVSSQNVEVASPELKQSESKVKVKMPKLFGKSKAKGSSLGDVRGPEGELSASGKGSKDLSVHTGELKVGKLKLEGDPGLGVSTKGKSASLDLFKKSRHRSSSLSDEGGLAVSSPSVHLDAEGGDISLDMGGSKVKGKKSKYKFGTFGGFGSKSKGSYEVTLGENSEAGAEGSAGLSLPSKKSRLSSSSSSDSVSRGGFRFPRLELSVSPKK